MKAIDQKARHSIATIGQIDYLELNPIHDYSAKLFDRSPKSPSIKSNHQRKGQNDPKQPNKDLEYLNPPQANQIRATNSSPRSCCKSPSNSQSHGNIKRRVLLQWQQHSPTSSSN